MSELPSGQLQMGARSIGKKLNVFWKRTAVVMRGSADPLNSM